MNKIAQKMLHHKKGIVALFAVLAVLCALLSRRVKVDYNMMHYLPKDAPSTIALDVMEEEYSAKTANCRIMIEDAAIPEALALKKQLQQVPGVSEVMWLDDYANVYAPLETLDGVTVESWYKEGNVLFAYLIINTVQLGATVDYAILFTNKYLENRRENSRWHAARITVRETVVSILTSGSILCIAGSMLGALSTNGVISQLGYLVGRGAVLSCCMVLFVLPTCLCLFDGLVQKTSLGLRFEKNY